MLIRFLRSTVLAAAVVVALVGGSAAPVVGDAIADKQAEAHRIAVQQQGLIEDAERLNQEQLRNEGEVEVLNVQIANVSAELGKQEATVADLKAQLSQVALRAYLYGASSNGLNGLLRDGVSADAAVREGYTASVVGDQRDLIDRYRAGAEDRSKQREVLVVAQTKQKAALGAREQAKLATERVLKELDALNAKVTDELKELVAEEAARQAREAEARQVAAAEQRARQFTATSTKPDVTRRGSTAPAGTVKPATTPAPAGRPVATNATTVAPATTRSPATTASTAPTGQAQPPATQPPATRPPVTTPRPVPTTAAPEITNYPAPSPGAGLAVAAARSQLGKPYVFGAVGPDTYDCSGLMMWAWAKAGVSMPHYTGSQFAAFSRVPLSALAPGDLVFFNIDLGHVGMYLGGGMYIHSPRTGDVVKISVLAGRNIVGAVRPG